MQRRDQVFFRDRSLLEELLHQGVVALGDHLDQRFVRLLSRRLQVGGNLAFVPFAVAAEVIGVSLHPDQVHDAAQVLLLANRQFQRNHRTPERFGQRLQHALGVGALPVHPTGHNQPRRFVFLAVAPHPLGDHFHTGHSIHHDNRCLHRGKRQFGLVDKHAEPGCIHDVDLGAAPLHVGQAAGERHLACDFLVVIVGSGGAIVHPAEPLGGAGGEQHGRDQRGLPGMSVPDHRDIPDIRALVNFHGFAPSST